MQTLTLVPIPAHGNLIQIPILAHGNPIQIPIPAHGNLLQIPILDQEHLRGNKAENSRVANRQVGAQASPSVFRLRVALRLHRRSAKNSYQILKVG